VAELEENVGQGRNCAKKIMVLNIRKSLNEKEIQKN
jgi:hypothetical protein